MQFSYSFTLLFRIVKSWFVLADIFNRVSREVIEIEREIETRVVACLIMKQIVIYAREKEIFKTDKIRQH